MHNVCILGIRAPTEGKTRKKEKHIYAGEKRIT